MKNKSFKIICLTLALLVCGSFCACDMSVLDSLNSGFLGSETGDSDSVGGMPDKDPNENPGEGSQPSVVAQELQIHFLQLGNRKSGDCTLIDIGETEVLIDAETRPLL